MRFDIFRRDQLRIVEATLAERPIEKYKLKPARAASAAERALYESWLGAPLPLGDEDEEEDGVD